MTDRELLIQLLKAKSVRYGEFTLASGRVSDLYIDARLTTMSPEGLALIGPLALATIRKMEWNADSIGGLTLGADPIAYAASYASFETPPHLRAFTVRKEPKQHGTRRLIEGPFAEGDRVVVVEDVVTSGNSALKAIDAVRAAGGVVVGVMAVVDRREGGTEKLKDAGFNLVSLVEGDELRAR
ncbi:MAG TPA: orotate phosphoribosyltransferase [Thermoanaerobaculia bacterium]|nr:orotate phosphoribosyltransferase [Thermoanaerobaculia bacterium]